jgi:hypothetical protein
VRQTLIGRFVALLLLFASAFVAPGTALAHEIAQCRAHAERGPDSSGGSTERSADHRTVDVDVSAGPHARDCEHSRLYRAIRSRVLAPSLASLPLPPVLPEVRIGSGNSASPAVRRYSAPAGLEAGPPPSLRAPPLR